MRIGVAEWYSGKGEAGEEKIFPNFIDAKEYIQEYWGNCNARGRERLTRCWAYEAELTPDLMLAYHDGKLNAPLSEYQTGKIHCLIKNN